MTHENLEERFIQPLTSRPRVRGAKIATFVIVRPAEGHREKSARMLLEPRNIDPFEEKAHARISQDLRVELVQRSVDRCFSPDLVIKRHSILLVLEWLHPP